MEPLGVAMNLLEMLAKVIELLVAWIPRPVLVPQYEILIRWTLAKDPKALRGLVWVTPLIHSVERIDLRANGEDFEPKILWTKDGKEAAVGMAVVWRVTDPLLCCQTVDSLPTIVSRIGESVLPELVGAFSLEELRRKAAGGEGREWGFDAHLRRALSATFAPYGITVDMARLNFTGDRVRTLKIIGQDKLA